MKVLHRMKSVHIPSFSGPYSVRIRGNTDGKNSKYEHLSHSLTGSETDGGTTVAIAKNTTAI